jgi:hypothetical protein
MPLLTKRVWILPDGEKWETWIIQWIDENGAPQRLMFARWHEATIAFADIARHMKARPKKQISARDKKSEVLAKKAANYRLVACNKSLGLRQWR